MKKYQGRMITVICDNCGKEFERPAKEVKRIKSKGRHLYCCRECVGKGLSRFRTGVSRGPASEKLLDHLKQISSNRNDEFTPFRYTFRCVKRRFKDVDITLNDLKEQWEIQEGLCPFTGLKLILPHDSNIHTIDFFHRASLDRIDSSKGYVKGNIQFISTPINLMKSDKSDESIRQFLKEISDYTSKFTI